MPEEMSPEVARAEIEKLRGSEELNQVMHPNHETALRHLAELYSRAYPQPEEPSETPAEQASEPPSEPTAPQVEQVDPLDVPATPAEMEALKGLQTEWAGQWEANVTAAQGVVESLSKDLGYDVADFLEDSRLGSHPTVVRAMWSWSRGEPGPDISVGEANAILAMVRKSDLYQKGDSRARDTLLDVVQALYRVVHPES